MANFNAVSYAAFAIPKATPALPILPISDIAAKAAEQNGLKIAREAFPDRAYLPNGSLVPRGQEGDVIHNTDRVVERAVRMATESKISAVDGTIIEMQIDTICVHGDNPAAVGIVQKIRSAMEKESILVKPLEYQIS